MKIDLRLLLRQLLDSIRDWLRRTTPVSLLLLLLNSAEAPAAQATDFPALDRQAVPVSIDDQRPSPIDPEF